MTGIRQAVIDTIEGTRRQDRPNSVEEIVDVLLARFDISERRGTPYHLHPAMDPQQGITGTFPVEAGERLLAGMTVEIVRTPEGIRAVRWEPPARALTVAMNDAQPGEIVRVP